jgi:hypothetical protein
MNGNKTQAAAVLPGKVLLALAVMVAAGKAFANPCPPGPPPGPPPYQLLTGTVTVSADSILAGVENICGVAGGTLNVAGTLTNFGMLELLPPIPPGTGSSLFQVLRGGTFANMSTATFAAVAGSITNGGTITNAGIFDPVVPMANSGSIANLAGGQFIEVGVLTSSGSITNSSDFRITTPVGGASSLLNSGTVVNDASGTFTNVRSSIGNNGDITNLGTFLSTGTINNDRGGTFTNSGVFTHGDPAGAVTAAIINNGSFINAGSVASFANNVGSSFTNGGILRNEGGAGFTNSGTFSNSGGLLTNSGTGTTFNNLGSLQVSAAGVVDNVAGAVLNNAGGLAILAGGLNNGATLNNLSLGTINVNGTLLNVNGTLDNASGAHISNQGVFENSSATLAHAAGTIDNHGSISNRGTFTNHTGGTVANESDGALANAVTGTWSNEAGGVVTHDGTWTNDGLIQNAGTIQVAGTITGAGTYDQTAGLTKLTGGAIQQAQINVRGGTLLGAGSLTGAVLVATGATLGPGDPHVLTINGPLTVNGGNLLIQIAGAAAGQYDVLDVLGGSARFSGGSITFEFLPGFVPLAGDTFAGFLSADGGISGLSGVSYRFLGVGQVPAFGVVADGKGLDLVLTPVPEPGTLVLVLAGGVAMLLVSLRRAQAG